MNYTIPLDAERGSIIKNEAYYVTAFKKVPNKYSGAAFDETTIVDPMIKITKTGDELSKIGDETTYSFEVENIGDLPLEKVKIYDSTFDFDLTSLFLKTTLGVGEKEKVTKSFLIPEGAEDPLLNSVTATY